MGAVRIIVLSVRDAAAGTVVGSEGAGVCTFALLAN